MTREWSYTIQDSRITIHMQSVSERPPEKAPPTRATLYFLPLSDFAGCALCITNDFAFWNSVLKPFEKSLVPCSKSTTKQNVKKTKSANQKTPRRSDMRLIVTYSRAVVNERGPRDKVPIEGGIEAAMLGARCACLCST